MPPSGPRGLMIDTLSLHSGDVAAFYYVREPAVLRAGPGEAHTVLRRLASGDSIQVGRAYPDGWARVWEVSNGRAWVIGWVVQKQSSMNKSPFTNLERERRTWPAAIHQAVRERKVTIGMTKNMVIAAWGGPSAVNTTVVRGSTREQWVYRLGQLRSDYVYFENGRVTAIQTER
jgi:hypothetical protein